MVAGRGHELSTPDGGFAGFVRSKRAKPWIVAIPGSALGGGLEISLACDIRVCADTSVLGLPEVKRGLFAGAGGVYRLPRQLPRAIALDTDVRPLAVMRPVLIDESDGTLEAFPRALELGYTGVSSKQCKGIYRSLLNAARCQQRNGAARQTGTARCFMSAEDLTTQAGLAAVSYTHLTLPTSDLV